MKKQLCLLYAIVLMTGAAYGNIEFHLNLLERGKTSYEAGDYSAAIRELRLAAFGFLERYPEYETSQIYLALSEYALGNLDEAGAAIQNLLRAENLAPTYRALAIDPDVRQDFEQVFALLRPTTIDRRLPERAATPPRSDPTAPDSVQPDGPVPPADSAQPEERQPRANATGGVDIEIRELKALLEEQPDSIPIRLALAEAHLRASRPDVAESYARSVLEVEPENATANLHLGRIAAAEGRLEQAVVHFATAQTFQPLSDEDNASLFVCHVRTGDFASALQLETQLSEASRRRADVTGALEELQSRHDYSQHSVSTPSSRATDSYQHAPAVAPVPRTDAELFQIVREARDLAAAGNCARARDLYAEILGKLDAARYLLLATGRGLSQCASWRDSLEAYRRAGELMKGEEIHMFHVAVDYFELGEIARAREFLARAGDRIQETPEVTRYRSRIEAGR